LATVTADVDEGKAVVFEHVTLKYCKHLAIVDASVKGETLFYGIVVGAGRGYAPLYR
jgi:hypothetical protein